MNYKAKNYSKENFTIYADAIIDGYKTFIDVYKGIKATALKMHGKVINKRFWTALNELLQSKEVKARASWSDTYNFGYHTMNIYLDNRSVNIGSYCEYFDKEMGCTFIHNVEETFLNGEGRIDTECVDKICDKYIESCESYIKRWEDAKLNFDEYKERVQNAVKEFGEKMKDINPLFKPNEISSYDWEHA